MLTKGSLITIALVPLSILLYGQFAAHTVSLEAHNAIYVGQSTGRGTGAVFYGIPYAEPPVGERRFRAPVPYEPTVSETGVKQTVRALNKPPFCIQGAFKPGLGEQGGAGSEDCLHLNVYTPTGALESNETSKLPVLVYIHGGGFVYGNPLSWPFEHWIEQFPDIVIVSVYYRLSIFGFLTSPGGHAAFDYNAGFLDQLEALKWVKKNIASFGGDPDRVTINGQSAGGASVLLHLLASEGKQHLFQQAIAQSVYRPPLKRPSEFKDCFEWIVEQAGCTSFGPSNAEKIECLREKDVNTLISVVDKAQVHNRSCTPLPVIDNIHFKDTPTSLVMKRKLSAVPILAGATTDEAFSNTDDMALALKLSYPELSDKDIKNFHKIYKSGDFGGDEFKKVRAAIGETLLRCGRETLVEAMTKAGKNSYAYRWDEPNPTENNQLAQHSAENWWMFQGVNTGNNGSYGLTPFTKSSQRHFAAETIAYWISFVRTGDPNTYALPGSPEWPKWDNAKGKGKRMVLAQGASTSTGEGYVSGSGAEEQPINELERCRAVNAMASRLHF